MTDWDSFEFALRYDGDALKADLINIEAYRLSLNKLILPPHWREDLQRLYIIRSVHGTTAIEGNPLAEEEVAMQLDQGASGGWSDQVHRQTENARKAFAWIEEQFSPPRSIRREDIHTIHELLTSGSDEGENVPGRLRESGHNVTVGSPAFGGIHRAPPASSCTERLLGDYLTFINFRRFKEQNVAIQALVAHFYFVTLHPFGNGNGRTTRCIEAAILYGGGYNTHGFYSLSNHFYRNRDEYFRLLQSTRTEHRYDLTQFLLFGLRGFREELERINAYVRNRTHRLQFRDLIRRCMEKRVGKRRRLLNKREAALLHAILDQSKPADPFSGEPAKEVTFGELWPFWRSLYAGKSTRTILRELARLAELGFLSLQEDTAPEVWRILINFEAIGRY